MEDATATQTSAATGCRAILCQCCHKNSVIEHPTVLHPCGHTICERCAKHTKCTREECPVCHATAEGAFVDIHIANGHDQFESHHHKQRRAKGKGQHKMKKNQDKPDKSPKRQGQKQNRNRAPVGLNSNNSHKKRARKQRQLVRVIKRWMANHQEVEQVRLQHQQMQHKPVVQALPQTQQPQQMPPTVEPPQPQQQQLFDMPHTPVEGNSPTVCFTENQGLFLFYCPPFQHDGEQPEAQCCLLI